MKEGIYLVMDASGVRRMTKKPPALASGELAVRVLVTLPDEAFLRHFAELELEVDPEAVRAASTDVQLEQVPFKLDES